MLRAKRSANPRRSRGFKRDLCLVRLDTFALATLSLRSCLELELFRRGSAPVIMGSRAVGQPSGSQLAEGMFIL